jgi:hypothetical protein
MSTVSAAVAGLLLLGAACAPSTSTSTSTTTTTAAATATTSPHTPTTTSKQEIVFGDVGSMFGGSTWTLTPDDRVVYSAYGVEGGSSTRPDWVWDNVGAKQGHLARVVPGAFHKASVIVRESLATLGPPPTASPQCQDSGALRVSVSVPGFVYDAQVENCVARDTAASPELRRHHEALRATQARLRSELGLSAW